MSHHDKIVAAFEAYQSENAKFTEKGVKASAARARKALQEEIAGSCKERRKEITAEKEALEGQTVSKAAGAGMSQDAARHAHVRK